MASGKTQGLYHQSSNAQNKSGEKGCGVNCGGQNYLVAALIAAQKGGLSLDRRQKCSGCAAALAGGFLLIGILILISAILYLDC
jgi:hypothetical protein